jgi:hypothetical protein
MRPKQQVMALHPRPSPDHDRIKPLVLSIQRTKDSRINPIAGADRSGAQIRVQALKKLIVSPAR